MTFLFIELNFKKFILQMEQNISGLEIDAI
jgi:hypothetical protein